MCDAFIHKRNDLFFIIKNKKTLIFDTKKFTKYS